MRMDRRAELDAYTVVNTYDEKRLADIIFKYGEDQFARKIARAICRERQNSPNRDNHRIVGYNKIGVSAVGTLCGQASGKAHLSGIENRGKRRT